MHDISISAATILHRGHCASSTCSDSFLAMMLVVLEEYWKDKKHMLLHGCTHTCMYMSALFTLTQPAFTLRPFPNPPIVNTQPSVSLPPPLCPHPNRASPFHTHTCVCIGPSTKAFFPVSHNPHPQTVTKSFSISTSTSMNGTKCAHSRTHWL